MPRPKPRLAGGTTALTACVKRIPPLASLGGLLEAKTPSLRELRGRAVKNKRGPQKKCFLFCLVTFQKYTQ
jgi:hypothetical protein